MSDTSSRSRDVFAATKVEAGCHHALQLHAEPRVGAPGTLPRVVDPRGLRFDHPRSRRSVSRCRHGPQDRTPRYKTSALSTQTPNNCDKQVRRRDELVPGRVCPKADVTMQQRGRQRKPVRHRNQGRERGGAKQRPLAESEGPVREGRQQVVVRHGKCRIASSEGSSRTRTDQQLNIREELMQAEAHGPKIRVRLWTGNHSEAEGDEHTSSVLELLHSCCTCSKAECRGNCTGIVQNV